MNYQEFRILRSKTTYSHCLSGQLLVKGLTDIQLQKIFELAGQRLAGTDQWCEHISRPCENGLCRISHPAEVGYIGGHWMFCPICGKPRPVEQ